jgi:hypothetical protein
MADDTDREATKARLLGMAADYEARAQVANGLAEPNATEPNVSEIVGNMEAQAEPDVAKPNRVKLDKKNVRGLKETIMVERHRTAR